MLGFAALRDAAASLEGRDSNYFNSALGGFEAARERERLRAQGIFQNQVAAAQALAQVQADIARNRSFGIEPTEAQLTLERMLSGAALEGFGGVTPSVTTGATPRVTPAGGAPGATPGVVQDADQYLADQAILLDSETGGVNADGTPFETPPPVVTPSEPLPEAAPTPVAEPDVAAQIRELNDEFSQLTNQVRQRLAAGAGITDLQFLIEENRARLAALTEAQAEETAVAEQQQATEQENRRRAMDVVGPRIDAALNFLISGYDEQGQPVLNPMLTTMGGIRTLELSNPAAYRQYVNALQTLAADTLIETLNSATFGALSENEMRVAMGYEGSLDPTDPYGTLQTLLQMRRNFEEISGQPSTDQTTGISNGAGDNFTEEESALIERWTQ
jgi:hypothetical protein